MTGALFAGPGYYVRELTEGDEYRLAAWSSTAYLGAAGRQWGDEEHSRNNLELIKLQWDHVTLVCHIHDGGPVGLIVWRDETDGSCTFDLELAPDRVGRGMGRQLVSSFIDYALGALGYGELRISFAASNSPALRLGREMGFYLVREHFDITQACELPIFDDERFVPVRQHFRREGNRTLERILCVGMDQSSWHPAPA